MRWTYLNTVICDQLRSLGCIYAIDLHCLRLD